MTEFCRSCRAPVIWAVTESGKWMPLDAAPDPAGEWRLDLLRAAVYVPKDRREEFGGELLMAHWATCPHAEDYRRKR